MGASRKGRRGWSLFLALGVLLLGYVCPLGRFLRLFPIALVRDRWTHEARQPFPEGLPPRELVYVPPGPPVRSLGFARPDGTGRVERTLKFYTGWRSMWGIRIPTSQAFYPRWSQDGKKLLFSVQGPFPGARVIDASGRMYGEGCDTLDEGKWTFDPYGNVLAPIPRRSSIHQEFRPYMRPDAVLIARHRLETCSVEGFFLLPIRADRVWAIGETRQGWITANFTRFTDRTPRILLYHPEQNIQKVFPGEDPAFSDDGRWLAYYDPDGLLIVREVEGERERVLLRVDRARFTSHGASWLSMPGWSPDGTQLIYNDPLGRMYAVDRNTGTRIYVGEGWTPDWR